MIGQAGERRVAVLVGSLRADGFSARLARVLASVAPKSLVMQRVDISDLALYNPELEVEPPDAWLRFRGEIRAASAVLFVTPEYNRSIPGALKNAVDVGSRPYGESVFAGKPAAVISQSTGPMGGFGANHALRQSLVFLDMPTLQQPEVYLGGSANVLGSGGEVNDEGTRCLLASFMDAFVAWIQKQA